MASKRMKTELERVEMELQPVEVVLPPSQMQLMPHIHELFAEVDAAEGNAHQLRPILGNNEYVHRHDGLLGFPERVMDVQMQYFMFWVIVTLAVAMACWTLKAISHEEPAKHPSIWDLIMKFFGLEE